MLGIVDYGMGNIFSIRNATKNIGLDSKVVSQSNDFSSCSAIILPGVGAFGHAMKKIKNNELLESLKDFSQTGKYILGICLGMQLLVEKSYEYGENKGLGLIEGTCKKFPDEKNGQKIIIPHTMWNKVNINKEYDKNLDLFKNIDNGSFFYFVHSYFVKKNNKDEIISQTNYHDISFCSAFKKDNIIGLQFHPEKSGKAGLMLLSNFKEIIKKTDL